MKLNYKFSNLCGTVYKSGNVLFSPDGNSVLSPVGNRVTVFDIVNNVSRTLPFESNKDIARMALSPNASILIVIDVDGRAMLINYHRQVVLHHHTFKSPVSDIQFSPNGRHFCVSMGRMIQLWQTPGFEVSFAPFTLLHTYTGHYDDITAISWSGDSKYFITSSKDMTCRVYTAEADDAFGGAVLSGHRDHVKGAWFSKDGDAIYSVSKDGSCFVWESKIIESGSKRSRIMSSIDGTGKEGALAQPTKSYVQKCRPIARHYFNQHQKVSSASFHAGSGMLVIGFHGGVFGIWEMPDFNHIHTLSISQAKITTATINASGEWLAFGCAKLGQLLVWEWQSESYVLKQQGHQHDMNCLTYSQDGQYVATGGDDAKLKLWDTVSGFCFVTFTQHSGAITAVEFARNQVVFSASLDGTVRAFDMIRYRNFKTFTSPSPVQFGSLAVDVSGEVVCAGTTDTFEVYIWSVQTGKLLDVLTGHEGPVSCMAFSPSTGHLATGSWDSTVRVWDIYSRDISPEPFEHATEVLALAYSPDGKQLCVSTLDGQVSFWDTDLAKAKSTIDGRKDVGGGRKAKDVVTSANSSSGKSFTSLCWTADGSSIIAGGNSKFVCIYDVASTALLRKFQISHNQSLDGMNEMLNSKHMTDFGPKELVDMDGEASDLEDRMDRSLPGVRTGDASLRTTRPEARTKQVRFSPTGRSWAAASTEGLMIYSIDDAILFDPFDLELDITPAAIGIALQKQEYLRALVMAFRLGEVSIQVSTHESIPASEIPLVARNLPQKYLERALKLLAVQTEDSPRLQFHLEWCVNLLKYHGVFFRSRKSEYGVALRALMKAMSRHYSALAKMCEENKYTLQFLLHGIHDEQMKSLEAAPSMDVLGL